VGLEELSLCMWRVGFRPRMTIDGKVIWSIATQPCVHQCRPDARLPRHLLNLTSHPHRLPPARMHSTTLPQPPISTPAPTRPRTPLPFRCPIALPSYHPNPTHESSAPRRCLAAGGATQQPPVVQPAVSRSGRWPHAEPSWLPSAARAAHSNTLWRPSGVVLPRMSGRPPCLGRPVRVFRQRRPVQRPPVQRLASGACPASACPGPRVRCPMSGVRCPVSMSGVRVQCPVSRVDVGCPVSDASVRHSCVSRLCPLCPHR
jgi:hypothetical protein